MTVAEVPAADGARPWRRSSWPLRWEHCLRLAIGLAAVIGVGVVIGLVLTRWTDPNAITELDRRVAERWAAGRTAGRTDLATWGARLSDTPVKIGFTALLVVVMVWRWRRWHEGVFVAVTLIFEATAFIVITFIVHRPRPDVPRLLDSPVNSSFPSGHVAAATVYAAFAVVVFWHTRRTSVRAVAVAVAAVLPVVVGLARIYQGMHFVSDVVAGVVLGLVSLLVCWRVLERPPVASDGDAIESPAGVPPAIDAADGAGPAADPVAAPAVLVADSGSGR